MNKFDVLLGQISDSLDTGKRVSSLTYKLADALGEARKLPEHIPEFLDKAHGLIIEIRHGEPAEKKKKFEELRALLECYPSAIITNKSLEGCVGILKELME